MVGFAVAGHELEIVSGIFVAGGVIDEAAGVIIPFPSRGCCSDTFEVCAELLDCDEPEVFLLSWLCLVEN